ncbi:MAG: hypothetical protein WCI46_01550 [Verrucomicrobiota bacterium]
MSVALSTHQPHHGTTLTVALAVLGLGATLQIIAISWAFFTQHPASIATNPRNTPVFARLTAPPVLRTEFDSDPFTTTTADSLTQNLSPTKDSTPPQPTPTLAAPFQASDPIPKTRFDETILQGKQLRDRGDTGSALIKFREALAMEEKNPLALAELAATFDLINQPERSAEQWRAIYDLGMAAGPYFIAAEAKLKASQARTIADATGAETPATPASTTITPPSDVHLELGTVRIEERKAPNTLKKFTLFIPIKASPQAKIEVRDLVIHVLFYDKVDGKSIGPTSANVNSKWVTAPADWIDSDTEELSVDYQLPAPDLSQIKHENRQFFGYIIRVYYQTKLQDSTAQPPRLAEQYPPPPFLQKIHTP